MSEQTILRSAPSKKRWCRRTHKTKKKQNLKKLCRALHIAATQRSVKSINDCGRVAMVRRSRCMGGHLTDLMTVRSGTGKDLKKNM